jgi:hypothetical protein
VFGKKSCQPSPDLRGVFEIIKHDNTDTIVNSLSVNESPDSIGQVVVSATRIVSEGNAETAHDFATWSTEAVAEAIAFVSSLYMGHI